MSKLKSIKELEMERAEQPNFGKGIAVASGFDLGAKSPLDSRLTVKTIEERDAHVTGNRAYEGMLVYVEADKKTYQLIDNAWEEFGFNEEKFQAGIKPLVDKNTEQDNRLKSLEDLVVGGEGEGLETIIADVAANKAAIAKEITDREAADTALDGKITAEVSRATAAEGALSGRLDVIEGTEEVEGSIAKSLKDAKAYTDSKISEAKTALEGSISTLEGRVTTAEGEISDIKDLLANNNSNTIVVDTVEEIATENPNPKVGDLAFVVSIKKAYIYKGVDAPVVKELPAPPAGWILFDEISTEVDLVNYLKKSEAEATYRKLTDKIAEADLATELSTKINDKADTSYVNTELAKKATPEQITTAVTPVSEKADANESAITKEVTDRKGEITRVEGLVTSVDGKVDGLSTSLTEKETALKAEDTKINNRINKFASVVSSEEPTETEAGHVWLELV